MNQLKNALNDKVGLVVEELHSAETDLARDLLRVSEKHQDDHEIHHIARDIARWSQEHVRRLAEFGDSHGLGLDPDPPHTNPVAAAVRRKGSDLMRDRHLPALLLLRDLRDIHRQAAGISLDWEVLAQTAQALRDPDLLALSKDCHPETLRQLRWANAKVKESAAQAMVT